MIDMRIKKLFFDRPRIVQAVDRARRRVLRKAGGTIRKIASRSIRKRKKISEPGQPPHSHEGSLRRLILYGYDPANESVVIGPVRFKKGEAPPLLEFGGVVTTKRPRLVPVGAPTRNKRGRFKKGALKRIEAGTRLRYAPRPFMGPSLDKERPKLPKRWANSVKG